MVMRLVFATALVAVLIVALLIDEVKATSNGVAFAPRSKTLVQHSTLSAARGGATLFDNDEEEEESEDESEEEEESDEEEEEREETNAALASSAVKATVKSKAKKATVAKKAVNVKLSKASASPAPKKSNKKKNSLLQILRVPYIIGACLNPVTLFTMAKGYWASLFNLDYLKQVRIDLSIDRSRRCYFYTRGSYPVGRISTYVTNSPLFFVTKYNRTHHKSLDPHLNKKL
jgi:hypothetical protein